MRINSSYDIMTSLEYVSGMSRETNKHSADPWTATYTANWANQLRATTAGYTLPFCVLTMAMSYLLHL